MQSVSNVLEMDMLKIYVVEETEWFLQCFYLQNYITQQELRDYIATGNGLLCTFFERPPTDELRQRIISFYEDILAKVREVMSDDQQQMTVDLRLEFSFIPACLLIKYYQTQRWSSAILVSLLSCIPPVVGVSFIPFASRLLNPNFPYQRAQNEMLMLIFFWKSILETLRKNNLEILRKVWFRTKGLGEGYAVYRTMQRFLPPDPRFQAMSEEMLDYSNRFNSE